MAEANELALAKTVFADLCASLDKRNWRYQKYENELIASVEVYGADIPMNFVFFVDADRQLLRVLSKLPFKAPEDKRVELAIATCVATYGLNDGSFDYDISDGSIMFRLTASFRQSKIGDKLFDYLIACAALQVDLYNDRFLAVCKGMMSIDDFIEKKNK